MSTALTVKVDEVNGRLVFSRILFLGSEYAITWEGLAVGAANPTLALFDCDGNALCVSVPATGEFKLNTLELVELFNGNKKARAIHAYAYADSVVMATGLSTLLWSPLSFDVSDDPVSIAGIAALWAEHTGSTLLHVGANTLAQIGAAEAVHEHNLADQYIIQDDIWYRQKFAHVGGQLTNYYEAYTP